MYFNESATDTLLEIQEQKDFCFAMTGRTFRLLKEHDAQIFSKVKNKSLHVRSMFKNVNVNDTGKKAQNLLSAFAVFFEFGSILTQMFAVSYVTSGTNSSKHTY